MSGDRLSYNPNQWESTPATAERHSPIGSRLEAIRENQELREKAIRLGAAGLKGAAREVGISIENGNVKVKPIKAARTLANPGGAAARAMNGARKGVRNEAIGMGREVLSGQLNENAPAPQLSSAERQPDYWSDTSSTESINFDTGFGETTQTSSWDTDDFGAPVESAAPVSYTSERTGPAPFTTESDWGLPIQTERSYAPSEDWNDSFGGSEAAPANPGVPKKKFGESQRKYEERIIANMSTSEARPTDSSDMW